MNVGPILSLPLSALAVIGAAVGQAPQAAPILLHAYPARVTLDDGYDSHRLIAIRSDPQGPTHDVSSRIEVSFAPAGIADFHDGRLWPLRDGETTASVSCDGLSARVEVTVRGARSAPPVSFRNEVIPILTRAGCNSGACHGAAAGKNGCGLTLFGLDPAKDHRALTRDYRGRRLDCADPAASLMLTKPTGEVRHKGRKRLEPGGPQWQTLHDWITDGAIDDGDGIEPLVALRVEPNELVLAGPERRAGIVVTAEYADGSLRDVTDLALISSSNPTSATVANGSITSAARGEAFVLARFGHLAAVTQAIVLAATEPWTAPPMTAHNEIDELVQQKLRKLRLRPAPPCDDATFLRRVCVDVIGQLPTVAEVRAFLADESPDKRARITDELLRRPEFADVWAMTWAEVLRIEAVNLETKGVHVFTRWLREELAAGTPIDAIVRAMLTASGSAFEVPAANYWITSRDPKVLAENAAQTFLGIRLQCAQ
ncbi:MAG: DUF1549 domain-containing protein, partial [Planctomycetes bacterium]|nr:DUF1549 domain-containing protein [Planctomycetota bacterium]